MGRFLDFVFNRFFLGMIATAFFWLLTLVGGIILGLAPASATLMSLYAEHGYSFREYSLKEAWSLYKQNFVSSNLVFYSFLGVDLVLIYGLYLLVQLPHQTIIHLIATFLNVLVVALIFLAYTVSLKLQVYFDLSYRNSLKLSLNWHLYELSGCGQGSPWDSATCGNWLLYACPTFLCRNWDVAFLYQ